MTTVPIHLEHCVPGLPNFASWTRPADWSARALCGERVTVRDDVEEGVEWIVAGSPSDWVKEPDEGPREMRAHKPPRTTLFYTERCPECSKHPDMPLYLLAEVG